MENTATISRRSFVKAAALAGAAAVLGVPTAGSLVETGTAYADEAPQRQKIRTMCHGCIQPCAAIAYVEDGVVVKVEGNPEGPVNKGSMCLKGLSSIHELYSPRRVLHPMKLVGQRGSNQWEVVSWDDALQLAAEQQILAADKYGDYSFWCSTGGGGGYSGSRVKVMQTAFGGCNQISPGACQCFLPRKAVAQFMYGGTCTSVADVACVEPYNEYDPTMEVCVLWGAQPATSQTAYSGRGFADLRDRGVKTVVIDPMMTPDAAKADVWLPVRPGSDTALMLSWFRYIFENALYDEQFVKSWTNLPFVINPQTKLPYRAEDLWPDYVNPAADPNDVYDTPAYVCFDAKTSKLQPFPYTAPEDMQVDPVIFATVDVDGVQAKTAGQIYREEAEPWTLQKAAEVCWLDADKIEEAILLYAQAEHAGIVHGVFSDMQECASQAALGTIGLDIIMGRVNKPGCTLTQNGMSTVPKNRPVITLVGSNGMSTGMGGRYGVGWMVGYTKTENDRIIADAIKAWDEKGRDGKWMQKTHAQQTLDRAGMVQFKGAYYWNQSNIAQVGRHIDTGEPYMPRFLYETSGNKFANLGSAGRWLDRYRSQDFIVQQYTMMTSFAYECVDLFLPLVTWLEFETGVRDIGQLNKKFLRRMTTHLGETADNMLVMSKFTDKVVELRSERGEADLVFDPGIMDCETTAKYRSMDESRDYSAKNTFGAESWDDLMAREEELNPVVTPPEKYWVYNQHETVLEDGLPAGFATFSRKCEVYCSIMLTMARNGFPFTYPFEQKPCADYSPICTYVEQTENALTDDEYPITLTSGRTHYWHHSTLRHMPFNRELMPEPEAIMNPETAAEYGIEDGDWILLTSRRGSTHGVARLSQGVSPRVVWMERFWNPECFDSSQETTTGGWRECNVAVLTNEDQANECFGSATYRGFQVKIEKSTKPERVWVEPKEFQPFMPTRKDEPITEEAFKA